jgi:hypothetical protein
MLGACSAGQQQHSSTAAQQRSSAAALSDAKPQWVKADGGSARCRFRQAPCHRARHPDPLVHPESQVPVVTQPHIFIIYILL